MVPTLAACQLITSGTVASGGVNIGGGQVTTGSLVITSTSPLPSATQNVAYSFTFQANGGVPSYSWSNGAGLPTGLSLSSAGVLSGTPTGSGTSTFNITVTDSATPTPTSVTKSFQLTVSANNTLTLANTPTLPGATDGSAYHFGPSQGYGLITGGTPPYFYDGVQSGTAPSSITISLHTSPNGLSFDSSNVTDTAGTYGPFVLKVHDSAGTPNNATNTFVITVTSSNGGPVLYKAYQGTDPVGYTTLGDIWKDASGVAPAEPPFGGTTNNGNVLYDWSYNGHVDINGTFGQSRMGKVARVTDTNTSKVKFSTNTAGIGGSGSEYLCNPIASFCHMNATSADNIFLFHSDSADSKFMQAEPHVLTANGYINSPGSASVDFAFGPGQTGPSLTDLTTYYSIPTSGQILEYHINPYMPNSGTNVTAHCASGSQGPAGNYTLHPATGTYPYTTPQEFCLDSVFADLTIGMPVNGAAQGDTSNPTAFYQTSHTYHWGDYVLYSLTSSDMASSGWVSGQTYALNDLFVPTNHNTPTCAWEVVTVGPGVTSGAEPNWDTKQLSGTNCTVNTITDTAGYTYKGIGGPAVFAFQLTDIASCSPNCTTSSTGTSGGSAPNFVNTNKHPDLGTGPGVVTTIYGQACSQCAASDNGLQWTGVGNNAAGGWVSSGAVSRDETRIATAIANLGYMQNGKQISPGQGSGTWMLAYDQNTNTYATYNTFTGFITNTACSGGTGFNCSGGSFTRTTLGRVTLGAVASPCNGTLHNSKDSTGGDYVIVAYQIVYNCYYGNTAHPAVWRPWITPGTDPTWQVDAVRQLPSGLSHWWPAHDYVFTISQSPQYGPGLGRLLAKIPMISADQNCTKGPCTDIAANFKTVNPSPTQDLATNQSSSCDKNWARNNASPDQFADCQPDFDCHPYGGDNPNDADDMPIQCSYTAGNASTWGLPVAATYANEEVAMSTDQTDPTKMHMYRFTHTAATQSNNSFGAQFQISQGTPHFIDSNGQTQQFLFFSTDMAPLQPTATWPGGGGAFGSDSVADNNLSGGFPTGTNGGANCYGGLPWVGNHSYPGNWMIESVNGLSGSGAIHDVYYTSTACTSGSTEPTWANCDGKESTGCTLADNTCTWKAVAAISTKVTGVPHADCRSEIMVVQLK